MIYPTHWWEGGPRESKGPDMEDCSISVTIHEGIIPDEDDDENAVDRDATAACFLEAARGIAKGMGVEVKRWDYCAEVYSRYDVNVKALYFFGDADDPDDEEWDFDDTLALQDALNDLAENKMAEWVVLKDKTKRPSFHD